MPLYRVIFKEQVVFENADFGVAYEAHKHYPGCKLFRDDVLLATRLRCSDTQQTVVRALNEERLAYRTRNSR